jgi:RinA family phage transcriptional activator
MTTAAQLKKETFKHIEAELYGYFDTLEEIKRLRADIILGRRDNDENVGGGRGNLPGRPTERAGTILMTNKKLEHLEAIAGAIKKVYDESPDEYKKLIKLKYWSKPQTLTWDGIAEKLHVNRSTALRWRDNIVYSIAERLGWH